MSQQTDSQDELASPAAPLSNVEERSSDSPQKFDESIESKDATDTLNETIDSQTSDLPDTPESSKEISDKSDSPAINKPKPVLGKIQAKKRLMAFANKFNVIPKVHKPKVSTASKAHSAEAKVKMKSNSPVKMIIDKLNDAKSKIEAALDIQEKQEKHSREKSKKQTEEKIFAIDEIMREDAKARMEFYSPSGGSYQGRQDEGSVKSYRSGRSIGDSSKHSENRSSHRSQDRHSQHSKTFDNHKSSDRRQRSRSRERHEDQRSKEYREKKDRHRQKSPDRERRSRDRDDKKESRESKNRASKGNDDKKEPKVAEIREKKKDESKREIKNDATREEQSVKHEFKVSEDRKDSRDEIKGVEEKKVFKDEIKCPEEKKVLEENKKDHEEKRETKEDSKEKIKTTEDLKDDTKESKQIDKLHESKSGKVHEPKRDKVLEPKIDNLEMIKDSDNKKDCPGEDKVKEDKRENPIDNTQEDKKECTSESKAKEAAKETKEIDDKTRDNGAKEEKHERKLDSRVREESSRNKDLTKTKDYSRTSRSNSRTKDERRKSRSNSRVKDMNRTSRSNSRVRDMNRTSRSNSRVKDMNPASRSNSRVRDMNRTSRSNSRVEDMNRTSRSNSRVKDMNRTSRSNSRVKDMNRTSRSNSRIRDDSRHRKDEHHLSSEHSRSKDKWAGNERSSKNNPWAQVRRPIAGSSMHRNTNEFYSHPMKSRSAEEYGRHLDKMMMIGEHHNLPRGAAIADGLEGPKSYPPESIRVTKNVKGNPLLYCENPRVSLLLTREQVFQAIPIERRQTMREICDTTREPHPSLEPEIESQNHRNWYRKWDRNRTEDKYRRPSTAQRYNKTIWDVEEDYTASRMKSKESGHREKDKSSVSNNPHKKSSKRVPTTVPPIDQEEEEELSLAAMNQRKPSKSYDADRTRKLDIGENLVSEYEQFMKMVSNERPLTADGSKKSERKVSGIDSESTTIHLEFDFNRDTVKSREIINSSLGEVASGRKRRSSSRRDPSPKQRRIDRGDKSKSRRVKDFSPVPSDWKDVVIKTERTSDNESSSTKVRAKRKAEKVDKKRDVSSDSSESSSSSSSSESEIERKKKKRKKKNRKKQKKKSRVKKRKNTKDSSSNTESSSSSSDDTSSDDSTAKRKRRRNVKRKHKIKRSKIRKKKRSRKPATESESSNSSIEEIKIKRKKRKSRKVDKHEIKKSATIDNKRVDIINEKTIKNLIIPEVKIKIEPEMLNEDIKEEDKITDKSIAPIDVPSTSVKPVEDSPIDKPIVDSRKFLSEEWENDSIPMPQKLIEHLESTEKSSLIKQPENSEDSDSRKKSKDKKSKKHADKLCLTESKDGESERRVKSHSKTSIGKTSRKKKPKKVKDRTIRRGRSSSTSSTSSSSSSDSSSSSSGSSSSTASKNNRTDYIGDWRKKKKKDEPIDSNRDSTKTITKRQAKWPDMDFDTLNVPSLTQLEKVSHKRVLTDEWEVDSMEDDTHEPPPKLKEKNVKTSIGTQKKVTKEVRYDRATDTYIEVERESTRENRKQVRLCAMRIWEEEQEEGDREQQLANIKAWESEEDCFADTSTKTDANIRVDSHLDTSIDRDGKNDVNVDKDSLDIEPRLDDKREENLSIEIDSTKRNRKSRWDISKETADNSDEKIAAVMWEQEEENVSKWTKIIEKNDIENIKMPIDSLDRVKKEDSHETSESTRDNITTDHLWSPDTIELPSNFPLKKSFEFSSAAREKDAALYSPSSPGLSAKSEDVESNTNSSNEGISNITKDEDYLSPGNSPRNDIADETSMKLEKSPIIATQNSSDTEQADKNKLNNWTTIVSTDDKEHSEEDSFSGESPAMKKLRMDMFAEYATEETEIKITIDDEKRKKLVEEENRQKIETKIDETANVETKQTGNESKLALKMIPKQLLVRKPSEDVKPVKISPRKSVVKILPQKSSEEILITGKIGKITSIEKGEFSGHASDIDNDNLRSTTPPLLPAQIAKITPDDSTLLRTKISPIRLPISPVQTISRLAKEESQPIVGESKQTDDRRSKSPNVEQKKRSPPRKDKDKWKPISTDDRNSGANYRGSSYGKDIKERKRTDERDSRSFKSPVKMDNRRRPSPPRSRARKRSGSPTGNWNRDRSRTPSRSRSWSRSRSRSPKRRDDTSNWDRQKRGSRFSDDRRDKSSRSPSRHLSTSSNKGGTSSRGSLDKRDRERDRERRNYEDDERRDRERSRERSSYDPLEMLRDADRANRASRFRADEETEKQSWRFEENIGAREGSDAADLTFANGRAPSLDREDRAYSRNPSADRDANDSVLHDIQSRGRYSRGRSDDRRDREDTWERSRDSPDSERYNTSFRRGERKPAPRSIGRTSRSSPRRSRSPMDRGRYGSRSRSRSWTRSRTRSRSRSRSGSRSRRRSLDRSRRSLDRGRRSRSISPLRERLRTDELRDNQSIQRSASVERGHRIETIVQTSVMSSGSPGNQSAVDSEMLDIENADVINNAPNFRYSNTTQAANDYEYYPRNNLTYPPRIEEATGSPKRLSLDDRLELELGIKKQLRQEPPGIPNPYETQGFNTPRGYPPPHQLSGPSIVGVPGQRNVPPPQHGMYNRPTVLQVGNVLQVVPADFSAPNASVRPSLPPPGSTSSALTTSSSANRVVRVGNVLQVVPTTTIEWPGATPPPIPIERQSVANSANFSLAVASPSPVPLPINVPLPVPVPVPVPMPANVLASPATMSPLSLGLPVPGILNLPLPITSVATNFTKPEPPTRAPPAPPAAQPVYNYEVILEVRRKEREERKRLREDKRREKEKRKSERVRRRAKRLLGKNGAFINRLLADNTATTLDTENVENSEEESPLSVKTTTSTIDGENEKSKELPVVAVPNSEEVVAEPEEEEEEEEEEEGDVEEDEEEEEEEEEPEEEAEEGTQQPQITETSDTVDTNIVATPEVDDLSIETVSTEGYALPPPPRKGILVPPGFWEDTIANGNTDDLSGLEDNDPVDQEDRVISGTYEDEEQVAMGDDEEERAENDTGGEVSGVDRSTSSNTRRIAGQWTWSKDSKTPKRRRNKKAVQFADGVRPGEGTSPSGGEGDMPSPPPPVPQLINDSIRDIVKRSRSRKSRKKQKRSKPPKTKKKVKVKIIKLKKPRITPLTAMMLDDSDDLDDRSPPPPPPGSPPPPHLWPSYLAAYNASCRSVEHLSLSPSSPPPVPAPPPPTPLPLLVPPPPLNYTIQPCSKA